MLVLVTEAGCELDWDRLIGGGERSLVPLTGELPWVALPVVAGLGEQSVAVRIYWIELEEVRQREELSYSRRFAFCCIINQLGDDQRSRHSNPQAQSPGCEGGRVLV